MAGGLFDGLFSGGGGLFGGAIGDAAANNGIDADYLNRIMQIESGGNPRAQTGSYGGLFQLSPAEFRANGGGDIYNPADNANAAARMMAAQRDAFTQRYGREPTPTEMYLTHQQGAGGLAAHMDNPDRPAWESMLSTGEGRQKGEKWAKAAIWGNIPDQLKSQFGNVNNVTSQQFMDLWRNKVEGGMPSQALGFAGEAAPVGGAPQGSNLPSGAGTSIPAMAQPTAGQMPPSGLPAGNAAPPGGLPQPPAMNPLLAGFLGFANSRSPMGALGNLVGGLATGHRTDEVGYQREQIQQAQLGTYQAIKAAGGTEQQAVLGALNPDIFAKFQQESQFNRTQKLKEAELRLKENEGKLVPFGGKLINPLTGKTIAENNTGDQLLGDAELKAMAEQYRAGDTTVLQNLGRGAQGAENVVKLRREIARQNSEAGTSGAGQAMTNAEFFGVKSGQRALGTKQANIDMAATEFKQVIPVVMQASAAVDRTNYPSLNKIIQAWQEGTGDPNIVKFGGGVNTLVNLYARAISPTGTGTVSDKEHAREILQKAWSSGQFNAAVVMMQQEIDAALSSPAKVREEQRRRFLGQEAPPAGPAPASPSAPLADPLGIR